MNYPVSRKGDGLRRALFLCEDNYLASRFCEELFNSLVRGEGLNWQAVSRAYRNKAARGVSEPMAPEAVAFLRDAGAAPVNHRRLPLAATPFDFEMSYVVVALAPREQFSAVMRAWPEFSTQIEFWAIDSGMPVDLRLREHAFAVRHMIDAMLGRGPVPAAASRDRQGPRSAKLSARSVVSGSLSHARISDATFPGARMEPVRTG